MASTPTSIGPLSFISCVGDKDCDPETRTKIRSHVMKGKNVGKILPGQKRRPRHRQGPMEPDGSRKADEHSVHKTNMDGLTPIPKGLGSYSSSVQTAEKLAPATIGLLLQCQWLPTTSFLGSKILSDLYVLSVCDLTKEALFSFGSNLQCDNNDGDEGAWVQPLASDAAYLHTLVFSSEAYFKWAGGSPDVDYTMSPHYSRTIKILQIRLAHGTMESKTSYTTVAVVLALAVLAHLRGDAAVARGHMQGICGVACLRGGIMSFKDNSKLLIQLMRCDLAMAMHNGVQPVFLEDICLSRQQPHGVPIRKSACTDFVFGNLHPEIFSAWHALEDLSRVANRFNTVPDTLILEAMVKAGYRLFHCKFDSASPDELMRLTLLALTCSIFLHWDQVTIRYSHLATPYKKCVHMMLNDSRVSDTSTIWILMAGQLCICHQDVWLREMLQIFIERAGITSWTEIKAILKSFVWIDALHNKAGRRLYESISTSYIAYIE